MAVSAEALAKHSFEYTPGSIDAALVTFIQTFYSYADDKATAKNWAASFTETGSLKKASANVSGSENLAKMMLDSWKGLKSRQHVVYKVFPFNPDKTTEVMLYGQSRHHFEDGSSGQMDWAARLSFDRPDDNTILISSYNIFPSTATKSKPT